MLLDIIRPRITLCGQVIDVVDIEIYVGSWILNNVHKKNIEEFVCDFEKRSNHIKHSFPICHSIRSKHIFATQCESCYDCEWFNYRKSYISKLYVSRRKIISFTVQDSQLYRG